jgi:hypothetical protein
MKMKKWLLVGLVIVLLLGIGSVALANSQENIASIRSATARFQRPSEAQAAGWDLVPGLDLCFENPGVGGMGYHYINVNLLDTTVDVSQPEAMVYSPGPEGKLNLAAVEYIVPAAPWDDAGNTAPPYLPELDKSFHLNEALGVYVLHAWIWYNNPAGMFEDWNPNVSCP